MDSRFSKPLFPPERIEEIIQIEPALVVLGLVVFAWFFYKIFLRRVSPARHHSLNQQFTNILIHLGIFTAFLGSYWGLQGLPNSGELILRLLPYLGLAGICWGALVFVKTCRLILLQSLFFSHMREGVPIVLVNSFTLILYAVTYGWVGKDIFNLQVAPLLATSAIFSILLGLALQDTLGNLFSGIALQLDKPFDLGDWVEVTASDQKWVGRVHEISWRATVLIGVFEEFISIPNRVLGQGQISNYSIQRRPIMRRYIFRVPYGTPIEKAKECLIRAALSIPQICRNPEPTVMLDEGTDSWIPLKLLYYIEDYGQQWRVLDQAVTRGVINLEEAGIRLAAPRIDVRAPESLLKSGTR